MPEPAAPTMGDNYIQGSDIALFVGEKMMMGAKSHKRQIKSSTTTITDKDIEDSLYDQKTVKKVEITISAEGFLKKSDTSIEDLEKAVVEGREVTLKYGYKKTKNGGVVFTEGQFVCTSLDRNDPASDNSTYSATFVNTGKPTMKSK